MSGRKAGLKRRNEIEVEPDLEKLDQWTILDHHNSILHDWVAIGEFLKLLEIGEIPEGTKLALGIISGRLIDGEEVNRLPVKIAILPNNEMRVLDSAVNRDILRKEISKTGTLPFRGKILELTISMQETEVPSELVPLGYLKCKECGKLFQKEGKKLFCSERCRNRYTVRKWRSRQKGL